MTAESTTIAANGTDHGLLAVEPCGIHEELKSYAHWVVWKAVPKANGRLDKVPHNPHNGRKASTTDSRTWTAFEEAVAAYMRDGWSGVGFVLSSGDPFTLVDFDGVRDPASGVIDEWVLDLTGTFPESYLELSPTGTGLHLVMKAKAPHNGKKRNNGRVIETYSIERFFTCSGVTL